MKDLLSEYQVDFAGFQETIKKKYDDKFFRRIDPYNCFAWHWLPATGHSGGVLCGVRLERFDVISFVCGQFSLVANVLDKKENKELMLATVYGPAQDDKKEQFLTELAQICNNKKCPMLIGGDFNILRFSSEKNKTFHSNKHSNLFNFIINSFELRDLAINGGRFTWSNNQEDPILEKLDRVLISEEWETYFPLTTLRKIPRFMSDHNPLLLCSGQESEKKKHPFCFETAWLKHEDFLPKVAEIWGEGVRAKDAAEMWNIKLKRVKKFLKGWGMSLKGHSKKYKNILQEELLRLETEEENGLLPSHLMERKTFIQTELLRLLAEEELYWHKRSNSKWLLEGDNNTSFFHRIANGKKRKNQIFSLEGENGIIKEQDQLLEHATQFYKSLFGPACDSGVELDPDCWGAHEKISDADNNKLNAPFTENEVKRAIFDMEKKYSAWPRSYAYRILSALLGDYQGGDHGYVY